MRYMVECAKPAARAIGRVLQSVAPAGSCSTVVVTTSAILSSPTGRAADGRGSSTRSSGRLRPNHLRRVVTVTRVVASRRVMASRFGRKSPTSTGYARSEPGDTKAAE